jgi:type VI secretion system secreted protein VgrG
VPDVTDRFLFAVAGVDATLRVVRFRGSEGISRLFHYEFELACEDAALSFDDVVRKGAQFNIPLPDGDPREVVGIVSRFTQVAVGKVLAVYRAEVVPKAWLLTLRKDCRIFQELKAPEIIKKVLEGAGLAAGDDFKLSLQGTYAVRQYCVQYRESDFDFISRLMEEEGIFYFFVQEDGKNVMVLADVNTTCPAVPGTSTIDYRPVKGGDLGSAEEGQRINRFQWSQGVQSEKVTLREYNFTKPSLGQEGSEKAGQGSLEVYDYPIEGQRQGGPMPGPNKGQAKVRLEQFRMLTGAGDGESDCGRIASGHTFTLAEHPRDSFNQEYLITEVRHSGVEPALAEDFETIGKPAGERPYENEFRCIPKAVPYRPARVTSRAAVWGPQTAIVVGPSGEEIYTDEHGRIKVQFHWDRLGKMDEKSSCWIRVGTLWAQEGWGTIHIPRIGQEVIVAFEEGDPDKPLVVGCVYHGTNVVPFKLPDEKTKSGTRSRSSTGADEHNFNELHFEDKKGSEHIYFHAEKDFVRIVENNDMLRVGHTKKDKGDQMMDIFNNQTETIGGGKDKCDDGSRKVGIWNNDTLSVGDGKDKAKDGDQTVTIWNNQTISVGSGAGQNKDGSQSLTIYKDRTTTLKTGNDSLTVEKGDRTVQVSSGKETYTIKKGRTVEVQDGDDKLTISGGQTISVGKDYSLSIKGSCTIEAGKSITLKVGGNSITIDAQGVAIKGTNVKAEADMNLTVKGGSMGTVDGGGMLTVKGGMVKIN